MLAGAHKKFYGIQHPELYLLDLTVQYKHKTKLPLDMVSKHVFLYLCLPDYGINDSKWSPVAIVHIRGMFELKKDRRNIKMLVYSILIYTVPCFFKLPCVFCCCLV